MNKTIELADKSYEVVSYSDKNTTYVNAGRLVDIITEDNVDDFVADMKQIAYDTALMMAKKQADAGDLIHVEHTVHVSFDKNYRGGHDYICVNVLYSNTEDQYGRIRTMVYVTELDEDEDNYDERRNEIASMLKTCESYHKLTDLERWDFESLMPDPDTEDDTEA